MHTCKIVAVAGVAGILALAASAQAAANLSAQEFVSQASIAGRFEIESSKLALDKSQNSEVKDFARRMIDDHSKANAKLKQVLSTSGSKAVPESALDTKHRKLMDRLEAADGEAFDSEYIAIQTDAHEEAVDLFSDYSRDGNDKALREFAGDTLPTLKEHREHVEKIRAGG